MRLRLKIWSIVDWPTWNPAFFSGSCISNWAQPIDDDALETGNLSANGPMIGNRPEAAQITAATESILNKTIPLINGRARLSISVTIGPSYSFEITEFTTSTSTTPTTTTGTTTTGAITTGATTTDKTGATTTGTSQGHGRTKIVRADTNPLNGGNRLALITHVKPGSSYSFDTTNVKYSKANEQIHLNVTMCNGNEADAVTVNRSNTDTYEVSAETIKRMIETFNCSVKSRVKRNNENGNYSMTLIIYVDKNDTSNNITIVGYSIYPPSTTTPPSPAPTHTTHTSSPLTSPSPAPTHTPTHTFTAASTTPPASSIGT
ncbi:unnamed protein product, partial [Anisakis simplex]|uniref:Uncharacterized protein n=1 Tax=Anisakis simplex TaxID=6269 RepID=A0A0M3KBT9_ANISI